MAWVCTTITTISPTARAWDCHTISTITCSRRMTWREREGTYRLACRDRFCRVVGQCRVSGGDITREIRCLFVTMGVGEGLIFTSCHFFSTDRQGLFCGRAACRNRIGVTGFFSLSGMRTIGIIILCVTVEQGGRRPTHTVCSSKAPLSVVILPS